MVFIALAATGCAWLNLPPSARQERNPPAEAEEPPQVVDADSSATEGDEIDQRVARWVDRLDAAGQRATTAEDESAAINGAASLAADTQAERDADSALARPKPPQTESAPPQSIPAPASQPGPPAAPELGPIEVRSTPPGRELAVVNPPEPVVNAPTVAPGAPTSLADVLERLSPAADDSFREQVDRRMMWVVAGDYERARQTLKLVTAEQQELAARFVEAWIVIREGHLGDPAGAAQAAARELGQLQAALGRLSDLRVPVVKICSAVYGYGQYEALNPPRFNAGVPSEFVLYCEVGDFVSEEHDDGYFTTRFDLTTTILNHAGDAVLELKDTNIVDRCRNRRRDCFIPRLVRLPATLSPGHYVAKVTVVDKLGQKVAQERAAFQMVARP